MLSELAATPLVYLGLTCAIYAGAVEVSRRSGSHPIANPVLLSVCCLIAVLWFARIDYQHYFANVQLIHFLLGPATVALAVPLFRHHRKVRQAESITAPVAMSVAEQIGGAPSLAAVFAVLTGMTGAAFGPWLLSKFKIRTPMERGLSMETTSHGQGTARILQESEEAGAFAGLAMGLTALGMAILLPLLARVVL